MVDTTDIIEIEKYAVTVTRPAPYGPAGPGYKATSESLVNVTGSGNVTFDTGSPYLAYTAGARIRATSRSTLAYVEGIVTDYTGSVLTVALDRSSGSGAHTDWDINAAGDPGPAGSGSGNMIGFGASVAGHVPKYNDTSGTIVSDGYPVGTAPNALPQLDATGKLPVQVMPAAVPQPGGRITLATGVRRMISNYVNAASHIYTPDRDTIVPIFDGTRFVPTDIGGELSQATTDSTKSPNAVLPSKVYHLLVWNDAGTIRCTRGPAWASDTSAGTGSGTSELDWSRGIPTNKWAVTNGPAAGRGTCVGAIRSNSLAMIDYQVGGAAAQGVPGLLCVYNLFNRRRAQVRVQTTTAWWNCNSVAWRAVGPFTGFYASCLLGVDEDGVEAEYTVAILAPGNAYVSIGIDTTLSASGSVGNGIIPTSGVMINANSRYRGHPGLGFHTFTPIEAVSSGTTSFYGGASGSPDGLAGGFFLSVMN